MSEHTPGPWEYAPDQFNRDGCDGACGSIMSEDQWFIATIEHIHKDIDKANARLIAAAPDLLAALKGVAAKLEIAANRNSSRYIAEGLAIAKAAIARAEGE